MMVVLLLLAALAALLSLMLVNAPRSDAEQQLEDAEQAHELACLAEQRARRRPVQK